MGKLTGAEWECNVFAGSKLGYTAVSGNVSYIVTGSYLDPNGCMVTHGSGMGENSFIVDTKYNKE